MLPPTPHTPVLNPYQNNKSKTWIKQLNRTDQLSKIQVRASRRERETRRPESDVTGMTRNAPFRLPLRNRNTSGEIGYDYSHFGEEDPHARLPKPRPDPQPSVKSLPNKEGPRPGSSN